MRFATTKVVFYSRFAGLGVFPLGSPGHVIIGTETGRMRTVAVSKPHIRFQHGKHVESREDIIRGMINDPCMCDKDGYEIGIEAIPEDIRTIYQELPREERLKVLHGLLEDLTDDEILDKLDPTALDGAKKPKGAEAPDYILTCPVRGCGLSLGGEGVSVDEAKATMIAHVHSAHPDWKSE